MNSPTHPPMLKVARDRLRPSRYVFTAAAIVFLLGAWGCLKGWQTQSWPQTEARILLSAVRATTGEPQRDAAPLGSERPVEVRYTYAVGGRDHIGGAIQPYSFGLQGWFVSPRQIGHYREGVVVRVAYDPDDAANAMLEPGPSGPSLMLLGASVMLGLVGWWLRRLGLRHMRRASP